ncbi:LamG domain-containing protein [bacterium]|nr:LamG domain-containing protein [bacterium]
MKKSGMLLCAALTSAIAIAPMASQAQDEDLILYYDYEAVSGDNAIDNSGKGRVGTINGTVEIVADGERGNVALFSSGSYIDMDGPNWPADQQPIDGMSLLAWVNVESLGNDHAIFNARAADDTWVIHPEVRSGGNFRWLLRSAGGATIFDIKAGVAEDSQWMHFAGVYDTGDGAVLYINGEEVLAADGGADIVGDWGKGARVGYNIDDARPFTGMMDDLNMWKRGLTQEEVENIMEFGPLPQAVDPNGKMATAWAAVKAR